MLQDAHLHFEIHNPQGVAVNPQQYISVNGAPLDVLPVNTAGNSNSSIISKLLPYVGFGVLGSPSVRKVVPGATGAATAIDTVSGAGGKALGFLTQSSNWKRIGLFAAGAALLGIVVVKTLGESNAVKSVAGLAAKAA